MKKNKSAICIKTYLVSFWDMLSKRFSKLTRKIAVVSTFKYLSKRSDAAAPSESSKSKGIQLIQLSAKEKSLSLLLLSKTCQKLLRASEEVNI